MGDFDGRGEDDLEREGVGEVATRGRTVRVGFGTKSEGRAMVGDGLAAADVGAVTLATAGFLGEVAALVWVARACAVRESGVWAAAVREPRVIIVTLTAASTHTATATAATATPGLARMLLQLTCLIARENRANQSHCAWRTSRRRYATASSAVEVQRLRTCSRSSWGSGASGNRRENAAGRIAPHP